MRSQTHAAAGILFALALAKAGVFSVLGHGYLVFAFFGALLPDIDNHNSKIGRKVPGLSRVAEFLMGHRGIYHSLFGGAITLVFFFFIFQLFSLAGWKCYLTAIGVGFFSHLIMDSITIKGITWLRPFHTIRIKGPFKTGGLLDTSFSIAFLVLTGFVLKGMGWSFLKII
jgi:inner membrane protein